jgi:L-aminopeptidase/D-esterase-like protein
VLAGLRDGAGGSTARTIAEMPAPPDWRQVEERNTTLVCVLTDAPLDKPGCSRVARMASAGVARAVDPVFSDVDGDVAFCIASGQPVGGDRFVGLATGTLAATLTAAAVRDSVRA